MSFEPTFSKMPDGTIRTGLRPVKEPKPRNDTFIGVVYIIIASAILYSLVYLINTI
jgi:hypothetical protein